MPSNETPKVPDRTPVQEQGDLENRTPESIAKATLSEGHKLIDAAENPREYKYFSGTDIDKLCKRGVKGVSYRPEGEKKEATMLEFQPGAEVLYKMGVKPGQDISKEWNTYLGSKVAITHDSTSVEVVYTSYGVTLISINNPDGTQDVLKIGFENKK